MTSLEIHEALSKIQASIRILSSSLCDDPKLLRTYDGRAILNRLDRAARNVTRAKISNAKLK